MADLFALVQVVVDAAVTGYPRATEGAVAGDFVGGDDFIRHAFRNVLGGDFLDAQFTRGDDHSNGAVWVAVDDALVSHGR